MPFTNKHMMIKTPRIISLEELELAEAASPATAEFIPKTIRLNAMAVTTKIVSVRAFCCNSLTICS